MEIKSLIARDICKALKEVYGCEETPDTLTLTPTKKEFNGEFTLVVFPYIKTLKQSPEQIAGQLGDWLKANAGWIHAFNVVKGFLNLELTAQTLWSVISEVESNGNHWLFPSNGRKALIEYSSPNTNKPLHLGHVRNILLGWSMSKILEANGFDVFRTQIINDRGIAICKSMLAWKLFGEGKTPQSTGIKGDHFVGDYYVLFENKFKEEYALWQTTPEAAGIFMDRNEKKLDSVAYFKSYKNEYFNRYSDLGAQARKMLLDWENGVEEVVDLWRTMNAWVYEGFEETYRQLGVSFDKNYYESETYLLGKEIIQEGVQKGVFAKQADGAVYIDMEDAGLDKKILLRSDGTSVYITQDIGTAELRYREVQAEKMIYVVADEQNYHFQALFEVLKRYGAPYADGLFHLSYGMVELPEGKMKSREGTVVDADDLIEEVIREATAVAEERGELGVLDQQEKKDILRKIGLGALKYFMVKVQARKRMIFDPRDSVDMQGHTGPYIQNAYVRIQSVLRKSTDMDMSEQMAFKDIQPSERELILLLTQYKEVLVAAMHEYDPSTVANYCYTLAKAFHRFYHDCQILNAPDKGITRARIQLCKVVATTLEKGMDLLGIQMPDRM